MPMGCREGISLFHSAPPSSQFAHPSWSQRCPLVSGPPWLKSKKRQGPCFQHLLRGETSRCESGIHLVGTGSGGAAICCPIPPSHHLSPGRGLRGGVGSGGDIALRLAALERALDRGGSALALLGNRASWRGSPRPEADPTHGLKAWQ